MASGGLADKMVPWQPHMVAIPKNEYISDYSRNKAIILAAALIADRVIHKMINGIPPFGG